MSTKDLLGSGRIWAWSADCGREWYFCNEPKFGQNRGCIFAPSSAPTPESIVAKYGHVTKDEDGEWQLANLTTTAINHKPAELFKGTCTYCVQCREWRRCGKGGPGNGMYACQRAHFQQAGLAMSDEV
jgi:hypothetical protein